jgi:plastocyanin
VVLAAFAFVASKPRSNTTLLGTMAGVAFLALAGAGVAGAAKGERTFEPAREPTTEAFSLVAKGTKFNKDALTVPAGKPFTVNFTNEDSGTYHNVAIWTEKAGGKPVMNGEPIKGVEKLRYTFEIRDPGTYAFRCDFHANMVGTVNAE